MRFRQPLAFVAALAFATAAFAQHASAKHPASAATNKPAATQPATAASAPAPASSSGHDAHEMTSMETMAAKPGDAAAGQGKAAACGACHGMDGNSTDPQYPKLAGENEQYIVHQLMSFKSGERVNAIMQGMAAPLSVQDMHDIGAYFAGKQSVAGVSDESLAIAGGKLYREGDPSRGIPACMACHGPDGHGNPGAMYPQLAGQHADYVQKTLQAWHDGTTWGTEAHAQIMPAIAQRLGKSDIEAVASYVDGLHTAQPGEQVGGPEAPPAGPANTTKPAEASSNKH